MLRFNAHLGFQFTELPFLDRIAAAAAAGFKAVEFPSPYEVEARRLADCLEQHGLPLIQFAPPMGGSKGLAALPGHQADFRASLDQALHYAEVLGCRNLHLMSGVTAHEGAWDTYLDNLAYAVGRLDEQGIRPLIEVISAQEMPGYFLSDFDKAERVLECFPQMGLVLDLYHAQLICGDAGAVLDRFHGRTVHVQIADCPGRHEPGTGSLDFATLLAALEQHGYNGWIGCEYRPTGLTAETLGWMQALTR